MPDRFGERQANTKFGKLTKNWVKIYIYITPRTLFTFICKEFSEKILVSWSCGGEVEMHC